MNKILLTMFSFIGLPCAGFAQDQIVFERYATAWAIDSSLSNANLGLTVPGELVSLIIPTGPHLTKPNGNRYIQLYLVNETPGILLVDRSDATVSGVTTEINVNGQWKIHQAKFASTCGHGAWKMTLKSKHYLGIELEDPNEGTVETQFRARLKSEKYDLVSNTIFIKLRPEIIEMAGTIPQLSDLFYNSKH